MTQDTPTQKPKNNLAFLILLGALSIGNLWGLYRLYQQHFHDQTEFKNGLKVDLLLAKNLKAQIVGGIERQTSMENELASLKNSLTQMTLQKNDNELMRIEWLLHQAEWQINVLKQVRYSKAYLRQAKKIALAKDFHSVADAIQQDLMTLKQAGITPMHQILSQILELKQKLDDLNPLPVKAMVQTSKVDTPPHLQAAISLLKPFIKIEHYHETPQKFLTAEDQTIIIQNLELLLAEIQYAAISSQQHLFEQLLELFTKEAQVLDTNANLAPLIIKLKTSKFKLSHPIHLTSLSIVQQLLQEKSSS